MASRPQGVQPKCIVGTSIEDQYIKSVEGAAAPGILYSVNISWTGAAADDLIHIHDTSTASALDPKIFTFRIIAATGTFAAVLPAVGIQALKGIWLNMQTAGAGKFSMSFGFD